MNFYDILPLPSNGVFYDNKQSYLKIEYLTTEDELLLTSPNIINMGEVIPYILQNKVQDFKEDDLSKMIVQDKIAILLYLREICIGNNIYYRYDDEELIIDLNQISYKEMVTIPENGYFEIIIPNNIIIKFRPLTVKEDFNINLPEFEKIRDNYKYSIIIKEININDNSYKTQSEIYKWLTSLPLKKYREIKSKIDYFLDFGFDMSHKISNTSFDVIINIPMDTYFFNATVDSYLDYRKILLQQINFLVTDGHYGYNDILKMPSHHRKENVLTLEKNFEGKIEAQKNAEQQIKK